MGKSCSIPEIEIKIASFYTTWQAILIAWVNDGIIKRYIQLLWSTIQQESIQNELAWF